MQQKLSPLFLGTKNCFLGTFYATKVFSIVFGNYKLLLGNFFATKAACYMAHLFYLAMKNFGFLNCFWELQIASLELFMQQNIFHWFWELIIVAWEHFMQQKLFPLLLGTTNCFLGTFYATKVISTIFGDGLQIASWELFMQQKLFPLFWGTTNCFLGTFYATKVISIVFGNYKLLLENFLCNKSCLCVWHISSCNEKLWLAFLLFWGLRNGSWKVFMQLRATKILWRPCCLG